MHLKNKTAILTGASTGIGKGIAKALLKEGAKVIVLGLHKPRYCSSFHKVDVRDECQVISALSKIRKIDILINNAGIACDAPVEKTTSAMLDSMIDINFKGVFLMSKHAIPKMGRGGCIVNISSLCGLKSVSGIGAYSAAKAAVVRLTETLAQELAGRGIRANCIAPGVIYTEMWRKRFGREGGKVLKEIAEHTLLKRFGTPEEIAHAVVFLCENEYVDGTTILVDGGQMLC